MIEHAQKPNPITKLEEKDKDQTCELSFAGDMIMFLFDHLVRLGIKIKRDEEREMEYEVGHVPFFSCLGRIYAITRSELC